MESDWTEAELQGGFVPDFYSCWCSHVERQQLLEIEAEIRELASVRDVTNVRVLQCLGPNCEDTSANEFQELFSTYGVVERVDLSRRIALVTFQRAEDARLALADAANIRLRGLQPLVTLSENHVRNSPLR